MWQWHLHFVLTAYCLLPHDISTEVFGRAYLEVRAGYFTH
jgi:hypothetical protein